ncbi:MAG: 4'-phosphopantetheinyl transferase superfamily protein [Clostridia bacterium]|nr:4'-phosphopantetheinyl transferase superfamily protein [Clostridia bacterium]
MEKIFYADKNRFSSSETAVKIILNKVFGMANVVIAHNENGKPYLKNSELGLHFSITHTKTHLFIAFSNENVGIDAEDVNRAVHYQPILKDFSIKEREKIHSVNDFLIYWTIKESAIKWLGGTLAQDRKHMTYTDNTLSYKNIELPVAVCIKHTLGHILAVCCERDFKNAEILEIPYQ